MKMPDDYKEHAKPPVHEMTPEEYEELERNLKPGQMPGYIEKVYPRTPPATMEKHGATGGHKCEDGYWCVNGKQDDY